MKFLISRTTPDTLISSIVYLLKVCHVCSYLSLFVFDLLIHSSNIVLLEDYDTGYDRFLNDDSWWQMVEPSVSLDSADAGSVSLRARIAPGQFMRHRQYVLRSETLVRQIFAN